jgi:hypothetical protein
LCDGDSELSELELGPQLVANGNEFEEILSIIETVGGSYTGGIDGLAGTAVIRA